MPDTSTKTPLLERINLRLILFGAVVLVIIGFPAYIYIKAEVTGGVERLRNGYTRVDLKAMSLFDFDQTHGQLDDVPRRWRDLDGQKVVLEGQMWAGNSFASELNRFDLCYSVANCCFSGPPQVQHFVNSRANRLFPYYSGIVEVTGTLHVKVISGEGKVASVYQMDVEDLKPKS